VKPDRNGLVPTPIVDSRGRHTTVHRRADDKRGASSRSVAAVPPQKVLSNDAMKSELLRDSLLNEHVCTSEPCRSKVCMLGSNFVTLVNDFVLSDERAQECLKHHTPEGWSVDMDAVAIYEASLLNHRAVYPLLNKSGEVQEGFISIPITLNRQKMRERAARIDKSVVPSFDSMNDLAAFVSKLYGTPESDTVELKMMAQCPSNIPEDSPAPLYMVSNLRVAPDLRGVGIGRHIMDMIVKHADEKRLTLALVPTEAGERSDGENDPGYEENRRSHYFRIKRFYESLGFVESPYFSSVLTFDNQPSNDTGANRLHPELYDVLKFASMIREPYGTHPPELFRY
jgi:GNAT superfamily N-acetyltransferase